DSFHAYAWVFYAYAWMTEAWLCQSHAYVWSCVSLLIHHAYAWFTTPMRAEDGLGYHA
ncbi:hypothetical protein PIB30_111485, partial [Stylosanthes scabra]|nr:hypothetical protein [Stylosanthes scabra]